MRKLLNTLYITKEDSYLTLKNDTVIVKIGDENVFRIPLLNLEGIVTFGYAGASPSLMHACAENNISLNFMSANGKYLASVSGEVKGNVLLRKQQYRLSDDENKSLEVAKYMISAKTYNSRWVLERLIRDHSMRISSGIVKDASDRIADISKEALKAESLDSLRGFEGQAANIYFGVFDELILQQKEEFYFRGRNRRPPRDRTNAMLSFIYAILLSDVSAALKTVGLDPYVGFMHRDRPGRMSLSLDMIEELRPVLADRFVLTLINKKIVSGSDFETKENGAVEIQDDARKKILNAWQERKSEEIKHPFLNEKLKWGLVPYVQAQLLARNIRGDLDAYPAFLWK